MIILSISHTCMYLTYLLMHIWLVMPPTTFSLEISQQLLIHVDPFIATEVRFWSVLESRIRQVRSWQ